MRVLVAYATKHGATRGIAEKIASTLRRRDQDVDLRQIDDTIEAADYDAFVIGSAAYMGGWLKEATNFVRRNESLLAKRPVWLFSSGPIGTDTVDAKGRDVRVASEPSEFAEFRESLRPRDAHVFFGAYDPDAPPVGLAERLGSVFTRMPAIREAMPAGDFRDWAEIEAWAERISVDLVPLAVPAR